MRKIIHHLRQKPDHHKRTIVFSTALGITILIFIIWLTFMKAEFALLDQPKPVSEKKGPLVLIKENMANAYNSVKSDLGHVEYRAEE